MSDTYRPTIGIECHVQFNTKTKLFAPVGNDARDAPPNTLISHICLGMPGALPVLNGKAIDLAIVAAHVLKTRAQKFSRFDRKHYFYPDLPLGYQISQLHHPIILGGSIDIVVDGEPKKIGVTRAHLEADAGKSTHPAGKDYSLVDLNRAGTPLLEVVSEPEMHSAKEAKAYARELYLLMMYSGVSNADLYYGNIRFDVNVSVSKTETLGTRTETKNLNSFRSVEKAVEYEIRRQIDLLEKGETVVQETRGWDDAKQKTFSQRSKEDAHDYRYFPDPDLPPVILEDSYIDTILAEDIVSVDALRSSMLNLGAAPDLVETILDNPLIAHKVVEIEEHDVSADVQLNGVQWLGQLAPKIAQDKGLGHDELKLDVEKIITLSKMVHEAKLSSTQGKVVFEAIIVDGADPETYAKDHNLLQVSDTSELELIADRVIAENSKAADDVRAGEMKAIGFLVGQVMKLSAGKANPAMVQEILKKKLS